MFSNDEVELNNSSVSQKNMGSADNTGMTFNPDLIQIKAANEEEVFRRIDAFIRNKRIEVNERNIREFISPALVETDTSCARTEAVYIHRDGEKSHISLKKVDNAYGPQTLLPADEDYDHKSYRHVPVDVQRADAVEERLRNMENHLNIDPDSKNVFSRIKALEERINFLEGLSPEYFTKIPQMQDKSQEQLSYEKKNTLPNLKKIESLTEINKRINQLKQTLKQKAEFFKCYAE
ncbi:hypothetical protein Btru_002668 [Bulinus truncatus]|nr:hypothetical protein Btru_002668 [Bulinus truncatus]